MADPSSNATGTSEQQLVNQSVLLTVAGGAVTHVPLSVVDQNFRVAIVQTIGYGVEIGASILMLAVILVMTPRTKFWRFHTFLNIAGLCNNIIRVILLAVYFESSWVSFYALYSQDYRFVTHADLVQSIASTAMGVPQNITVMWALILQAWAMVRLWPRGYRLCILLGSAALVLLEIGFMGASQAYQIMALYLPPDQGYAIIVGNAWVRYGYLGLEVACICWFCFLFVAKLAAHLWESRSFLPATKGLGAMDALVMTNGVLMLVPVFFAALQYSNTTVLQTGSMVYTAVLVVLPLGCLVAQRISDPAAFGSERRSARAGGSGSKARLHHAPAWRRSSQSDNRGRRASSSSSSSTAALAGGQTGVTSTITGAAGGLGRGHMRAADMELARIDADVESGKVMVLHEIRQEVLQ